MLLLDEPTSGLDPISTGKVEESLLRAASSTTPSSSSRTASSRRAGGRHAAFFLMGELVEYRPGNEIFTAPHDKRTEDYMTGRFG